MRIRLQRYLVFTLGIISFLLARSDLAFCQAGTAVPIAPKIALIIGNCDYNRDGVCAPTQSRSSGTMEDLRNACNDAELIEKTLLELKWDPNNIIMKCNATKAEMLALLDQFNQRYMSSSRPFGFIYYAGHGVQVNEDTYIFGVDTTADVDQAVNIFINFNGGNLFVKGGMRLRQDLLSTIGDAGGGSIFFVLDARRNNPLVARLKQANVFNVSAPVRGRPMPGIKNLYSTANGDLADDGVTGNSPFASAFAEKMKAQPNIDLFIRSVVSEVWARTKLSPRPQVPEESGSFNPPPPDACLNCGG